MAFSVETALDEYVASLEVERKPDGTWHPSSISGCPRKALYDFNGVPKSNPHNARTSRVFRVGHLLHEFIQEAIQRSPDVKAVYVEVKIDHPGLRVSGAVDGLVEYESGTWEVLEFKTINSQAFKYGDLPKEDHKVQAGVYTKCLKETGGLATRSDGVITTIPPLGDKLNRVRFVYVSKDDMKIEEHTMLWTPAKDFELIQRLALLELHLGNDTLPDRLPFMEKKGKFVQDYRCGYCPYKDTCWEDYGDE